MIFYIDSNTHIDTSVFYDASIGERGPQCRGRLRRLPRDLGGLGVVPGDGSSGHPTDVIVTGVFGTPPPRIELAS